MGDGADALLSSVSQEELAMPAPTLIAEDRAGRRGRPAVGCSAAVLVREPL
jgi:hypothetical protein